MARTKTQAKKGKRKSNTVLLKIYKQWLKHERFEPIRDKKISIDWSPTTSFGRGDEAWALCWDIGPNSYCIRINAICKEMDAPDYVVEYLVAHEMIHMLPGCGPHNQTFWDNEIKILGEDYYKAALWINQHRPLLKKRYYYRNPAWLKLMINREQLRIKDMAEVCGCSETTIKRWMRKFDIYIVNQ